MADLGTFTLRINGRRFGDVEETTAKVRVRIQGQQAIKDDDADQFWFPIHGHDGESVSLPYTLLLPTDVPADAVAGTTSEVIGYEVLVKTAYGRVETEFAAQKADTTVNLDDVTPESVEPPSSSLANALRAEAAAALAELAADRAVAAANLAEGIVGGSIDALQPFMRKVAHAETATIALLGDSLSDADDEYGHLLGERLADSWPTRTVTWTPPADDTYAAGTTETIQTGTSGSIVIYNNAISGSHSYNWQSSDFLTRLTAQNPDLVLICSGHNDGAFTGDPQTLGQPRMAFRLRYLAVVEDIKQRLPNAQIVLVSQNEWSDGTGDMDQKRDEFQYLAKTLGVGFIDVYQAWHDAGAPSGWYQALPNIVHPNSTGEAFYADTIASYFTLNAKWEPRPAPPSLFDNAHPGNLAGDMVMPLTATAPDGWTPINATVSRDTTHFESKRGYAIRVQRTAPGTASRITYQVLDSTSVVPYRGQWLLIAARMYRAAAGDPTSLPPAGNRFVGRLSVSDGVAASKNMQDDKGYGTFMWRFVPHFVDPAATALSASLWADNSNAGDATNPDVTFDRFYVIPGLTPVGHTRTPQAMRNAQSFEAVTVGSSTFATPVQFFLDAINNVQRMFQWRTAGVRRWQLTTTSNETGSNVGSDLAVQAYDDSGTLVGTNVTFNRKRLNAVFGSWLNLGTYTTATRPNAGTAAVAAHAWDTDLSRPIWSDGSAWSVGAVAAGALNAQTGTTYTFALADFDKTVTGTNASAQTYTVPPNSSVAFPVGTYIEVVQLGAGQITLAAGAGVTVSSRGAALKLAGQYAVAGLRKVATDTWIVTGDLTT